MHTPTSVRPTFREAIDHSPMSARQWLIIAIAAFINMLDGYDLVAMAFTATAVSEDFGLNGSQLGWLLSSALLGIGIGSILLGPLADRFGRRRLIIVALVIDLIGLTMTSLSDSLGELLLWRVITGIGVGGILACVTVLVSEFSNLRFRGLAMSIYSSGYGIGAAACGILAARTIPTQGWQTVFIAGAVLTAVALVVTVFLVPETAEVHAGKGRQDKIIDLARTLGKETDLAPTVLNAAATPSIGAVLRSDMLKVTLRIWIAFSLINFAFTFANQWTPKLLTEAGLSAQQGIIGGIMLSFGGTIGSLIYGALTTKINARKLLIVVSLLATLVLVAFIYSAGLPTLMFTLGVAVGMLLNAGVTGMYTITPQAYPAWLRTTGVGTAIGVSRVGSVTAPIIVGYLVDAGWSPASLYVSAGLIVGLTALALIGVREYSEPKQETTPAPNQALAR